MLIFFVICVASIMLVLFKPRVALAVEQAVKADEAVLSVTVPLAVFTIPEGKLLVVNRVGNEAFPNFASELFLNPEAGMVREFLQDAAKEYFATNGQGALPEGLYIHLHNKDTGSIREVVLQPFLCTKGPDGVTLVYVHLQHICCSRATPLCQNENILANYEALLQAGLAASEILFSDEEDMDSLAAQVLGAIGKASGATCVEFWRNFEDSVAGLSCAKIYDWSQGERPEEIQTAACLPNIFVLMPEWQEALSKNISISTVTRKSPEELSFLRAYNIGSIALIPVFVQNFFWGFISLASKQPMLWADGTDFMVKTVGLFLAATLRRRSLLDALKASQERFVDVSSATGEILWEVDAQGSFFYLSERIEELTGYTPDELYGKRWENLCEDGENSEITSKMLEMSLATGIFKKLVHKIVKKNGGVVWLSSAGRMVIDADGFAGLRGTSLDISNETIANRNLSDTLVQLEHANENLEAAAQKAQVLAREAEQASLAKSQFIANIGHEIRTPLNAITGMSYLLAKTNLDELQKGYVDRVYGAGQSLLKLINDILDFSSLESQALTLDEKNVSLANLFEGMLAKVSPKAQEKGITLAFLMDQKVPPFVKSDPQRLEQVFFNIIDNAIKFTQEGYVYVYCNAAETVANHVTLQVIVEDSGIGIAKEDQERLFAAFTQGDGSMTRSFGGVGLGLAIAQRVLEQLDGSLTLESDVGVGTTVKISLSLPLALENIAQIDPHPLKGTTVMLAEPLTDCSSIVYNMLENFGCRVVRCNDPETALKSITDRVGTVDKVDVLIMDSECMKSHQDRAGECVSYLRTLNPAPVLVTILAQASIKMEQALKVMGIDHVINYPLYSGTLLATLQRAMAQKRHGQSGATLHHLIQILDNGFAQVNKGTLLPKMEKLLYLLEDADAEARSYFYEIEASLAPIDQEITRNIATSINQFDFAEAADSLRKLQNVVFGLP